MNLLTLLSVVAVAQTPGATIKTPSLFQAALFKNGYSALVRRVELDADGDTMISGIAPAVMGTFWVYGSPGVKVESLVNTTVSERTQVSANSVAAILALNKGAQVALETKTGPVSGKLVEINSVAVIEGKDGIALVPTGDITRATIMGPAKLTVETQTSSNGLRVRSNGGGTLFLLSVEPGLSWAPQYWVDLQGENKLKLTLRTSLVNDIGELKGADISFVAGAPNMPFLGSWDPFTLIEAVRRPGGFGGGGVPGGMMQNAAPAAPTMDMAAAFDTPAPEGNAMGELFFYRRQKVDLKQGERGYYVLFEATSEFSTLYTLNVNADESNDVVPQTWQTIKFKNNSGVPLTSAPATAYRDNNLVGQDELRYTPIGGEASLRLARAVDIPAKLTTSEVDSDTIVIDRATRQRVTRTGVIDVQNLKREEVRLEVSTFFGGQIVTAEGDPVRRVSAERVNELNPTSTLKWEIRLKPGERRALKFSYRRVL